MLSDGSTDHKAGEGADSSAIDHVLSRLRDVKKTAAGWRALCPAHDDSRPSLDVTATKSGAVLLRCRSRGCSANDIVTAAGLTLADLFPKSGEQTTSHANGKPRLGKIIAAYDYRDREGRLLYQVTRHDPKDFRQRRPDENGGWLWGLNGTPRTLYRLPELLKADPEQPVFIVEGEKDVDNLGKLGLVATCNSGGAGKWHTVDGDALIDAFTGRLCIVIPDNDEAGRKHAEDVALNLDKLAEDVRILTLDGLPEKGDVSDWLAAGGTAEQLSALAEVAPKWPSESYVPPEDRAAYEKEKSKPADKPTFAFRWEPIASGLFFSNDYRPDWLVKGVIVRGQPLVCGAPQKTLKTTAMIDAGISLASATPWLNTFPVPVRRRVAILSGESGPFTLQETGRRICVAKNIDPADLGDYLHWQFQLPQLAVHEQLDALRAGLERDRIEVAIVDPLYLSLLSGSDARAENLFDTGPLLLRVAQACEAVGATLILLHHTPKPAARKLEPLELTDLAFSGTAEFARQWLLLSRREVYEPGSGVHKLWMVVGGSVGHGGLYALDIDEGRLADDFTGRKWDVVVIPASQVRAEEKDSKAKAKAEERRARDQIDETAVLAALNQLARNGAAVAIARVRDLAGLGKDRMNAAVERLIAAKAVRPCEAKVTIGNGAERPAKGIQKVPEEGQCNFLT